MTHMVHIGRWIQTQTIACDTSMSLPAQLERMYQLITKSLLMGVKEGCRITDDKARLDFRWRWKA